MKNIFKFKKNTYKTISYLLLACGLYFSSCTYADEGKEAPSPVVTPPDAEPPVVDTECQNPPTKATLDEVWVVMEKNCLNCHRSDDNDYPVYVKSQFISMVKNTFPNTTTYINDVSKHKDANVAQLDPCDIVKYNLFIDSYTEPTPIVPTCQTNNITYSNDVSKIMTKYCVECHKEGGTFPRLDNYTDLKKYFNRSLTRMIAKTMPPASYKYQPTNCEITQFDTWGRINGAPNN